MKGHFSPPQKIYAYPGYQKKERKWTLLMAGRSGAYPGKMTEAVRHGLPKGLKIG